MLQNRSVGAKLNATVALMGGCLAILGVAALWSVSRLEKEAQKAFNVHARKVELFGRLEGHALRVLADHRSVLLWSFAKQPELAKGYATEAETSRAEVERALGELAPLMETDTGRQAIRKMGEDLAAYWQKLPPWLHKVEAGALEEAAREQSEQLRPLIEGILGNIETASKTQAALMKAGQEGAAATAAASYWISGVLLFMGALAGVAAVWFVGRSLGNVRSAMGEMASGARQVASAAQQVSSVSQSLAQGSSEQAASLEETSASTEEINSMTKKNAENARAAAEEAVGAEQRLTETTRRLEEMLTSMREINASSEKIGKIIKVIDEIAFQTNILALNAAVEAARAGEAGMGFAVVADEVRNLAQRSAQAAKDTSQLIEESIRRSTEGKLKLDEVAASIGGVVDNAGKVKLLANEVNVGSQEQARGIDQIAKAVIQMQQLTQSTAASAEEGASAGEEMSSQAATLTRIAQDLEHLLGAGGSTGPTGTAAPKETQIGLARLSRKVGFRPKSSAPPVGVAAKPSASKPSAIPMDDDFRDF